MRQVNMWTEVYMRLVNRLLDGAGTPARFELEAAADVATAVVEVWFNKVTIRK